MSKVLFAARYGGMLAAALLVACGGGYQGSATGTPSPPMPMPMPSQTFPGVAVVKFRSQGNTWAALVEKLRPLVDRTIPDRRLLMTSDSATAPIEIDPPPGWSLIDFALHPSGEVTAILDTDKLLRLQRFGVGGVLLADMNFIDTEAANDPFVGDTGAIVDSNSLVPAGTLDAARLAPIGDDLVVAFRTGRNAVVVERHTYRSGRFDRAWRTLAEPGAHIDLVRLTGGSFDPFASLDNQWQLVLDVDAPGRSAVAVNLVHTDLPAAHRQYFGEPIDSALFSGALVTRIDANGNRIGATPVDTHVESEVHAIHWSGDTVLVAGRMLTVRQPDGTGWDGFIMRLANNQAPQLQTVDVDRGDIVFDLVALADGRVVFVGASGYTQNPQGGSISEDATPLLAVVSANAGSIQRIAVPAGPRQTQVRTIAAWHDRWMIGGLQNGPGTHSADSNPALLTCDGFLREQDLPL